MYKLPQNISDRFQFTIKRFKETYLVAQQKLSEIAIIIMVKYNKMPSGVTRLGPYVIFLGLLMQAYSQVFSKDIITTPFLVGCMLIAIGGIFSAVVQTQQTNEIIRLNTETISNITGGDSFCSLQPLQMWYGEGNPFYWVVTNHGDYPLLDVEICINAIVNGKWQEHRGPWYRIGNIPPKSPSTLNMPVVFDSGQFQTWEIHMRTRYKYFHEHAYLVFTGGNRYESACAFYVKVNGKIIHTKKDSRINNERLPQELHS